MVQSRDGGTFMRHTHYLTVRLTTDILHSLGVLFFFFSLVEEQQKSDERRKMTLFFGPVNVILRLSFFASSFFSSSSFFFPLSDEFLFLDDSLRTIRISSMPAMFARLSYAQKHPKKVHILFFLPSLLFLFFI